MTTLQLFGAALLLAGLAAGCGRGEPDEKAQRTADRVRTMAARAGDQLADSWLTTKVQAQFFADDDIKARHINVSTRDGVVTLTGDVGGERQRALAEQIAETTDGVRGVRNHLTIRGAHEGGAVATTGQAPDAVTPAPAVDDAQVIARVQSRFFVDERVKGSSIAVDSRQGVVSLSGEVATEEGRAQALLLARTTDGVARVEDHLTVAPAPPVAAGAPGVTARPDDQRLTTTIQARYFVDALVKGSAVEVSTRDGIVLLQGTVPSEEAHKQAMAIALNTEGVLQVVDRLTVAPSVR